MPFLFLDPSGQYWFLILYKTPSIAASQYRGIREIGRQKLWIFSSELWNAIEAPPCNRLLIWWPGAASQLSSAWCLHWNWLLKTHLNQVPILRIHCWADLSRHYLSQNEVVALVLIYEELNSRGSCKNLCQIWLNNCAFQVWQKWRQSKAAPLNLFNCVRLNWEPKVSCREYSWELL